MRPSLRWGIEVLLAPARRDPCHFPDLARSAEDAGFDALWLTTGGSVETASGRPDPLPLMGALAMVSSRLLIGAGVTVPGDRHPAILAKQVTGADVVSAGRAGVLLRGAGRSAGHLVEAVGVCRAVFSDVAPVFAGVYYRIEDAINLPRPVATGGPALLASVGSGASEEMRSAVKALVPSADAVVVEGGTAELEHAREAIDAIEGDREVRSEGSRRTGLLWCGRLPTRSAGAAMHDLREAGADGLICRIDDTGDWGEIERLGEHAQR